MSITSAQSYEMQTFRLGTGFLGTREAPSIQRLYWRPALRRSWALFASGVSSLYQDQRRGAHLWLPIAGTVEERRGGCAAVRWMGGDFAGAAAWRDADCV